MRARSAQFAIVVAAMLAVAGCRSGGSGWGRGRKSGADASTATASSGPQLPSANAAQPNYGSSYSSAAAPQGTSAFADPNAAPPYQPNSYPGQPASYDNRPGATAGAYGAAPPPAAPNHGASAATPQQGPYGQDNGQPPAGGTPAAGYPTTAASGGYPPTAAPGGYETPMHAGGPPVTADPYAATGSGTPPSEAYPNAASAHPHDASAPHAPADAGGYASADNRYAANPAASAAASPEQATADQYAAAGHEPSASPAPGEQYRPGSTSYNPGQTGYSPPGVPQYQVPAQPNVVAATRRPYYRPGGTSDYTVSTPSGQTPTAASSSDRYNTPTIGATQPDPYAPTQRY